MCQWSGSMLGWMKSNLDGVLALCDLGQVSLPLSNISSSVHRDMPSEPSEQH